MADFPELRQRHIDAVRAFTSEAVGRLTWSRDRVRHEQTQRLRKVIAHAKKFSPTIPNV